MGYIDLYFSLKLGITFHSVELQLTFIAMGILLCLQRAIFVNLVAVLKCSRR